ncbi:pirin family protein [Pseudomonas sp. 6D_7.1_Bac1]|uniref:pirin family protein n=1 Tax=Pseudomonas sp. 6D_7.1_Bac1 TaxID=2971615 RepID=UPI0021C6F2B2|nr:pirin family protein [Pseudomonas sp. 6D_7.1_Bac1]MCU1752298.1 pirin family protein [Pseudomonas sp. 6D_7.1_Bac1]
MTLSTTTLSPLTAPQNDTSRGISRRTRGQGHGPIVRLMSPSDLGQLLKPFVFLDLFEADASFTGNMPLHPHSGIATITVITEGNLHFDDPDAGSGFIGYGGVEWMRAGAGVWHGKEMSAGTSARIQGFQLWIALPADLENAPVDSQYLEAPAIPQVGPARVILGDYQGIRSPVRAPSGVNYLLVTLAAGQRWEYEPPTGHEVLWLSVSRGAVHSPQLIQAGELVAFTPASGTLKLEAGDKEGAVFVLGSAIPHPHDLKMGNYSVHTSLEALRTGEAKIAELGKRLRAESVQRSGSVSVPIYK